MPQNCESNKNRISYIFFVKSTYDFKKQHPRTALFFKRGSALSSLGSVRIHYFEYLARFRQMLNNVSMVPGLEKG